jgi:hypothetical protein
MLTACGAVLALILLAWLLADHAADGEHVRIEQRVD